MNTEGKLSQHMDLFIENGFEDLWVIQDLAIAHLMEMEIEKKGQRMKIAKLKEYASKARRDGTAEGSAWIISN